jgi:putative phosphoesterase
MQRIGVIADTHGLLRPEAIAFLQGCSHIIHAGDIGDAEVLNDLASLAPVTAVRGNNDAGEWAQRLRERETIRVAGVNIHVIHDLGEMQPDAEWSSVQVVVSGHSHKPAITQRADTLFLNPGSAGPRRFKLPVSIGELIVRDDGSVAARIQELSVTPARRPRARNGRPRWRG